MAKITPKENFLRLAGGGMPAYVPYYNMQGYPDLNTYEVATMAVNPNIFNETMFLDGGYDMWAYATQSAIAPMAVSCPCRMNI